MFGTIQDVTDRRTAVEAVEGLLEQNRSLLRELNHRMKNNLAMISGLIAFEEERVAGGEAKASLQKLGGRVASLAVLYETLNLSGDAITVRLDLYLGTVVSSIAEALRPEGGGIDIVEDYREIVCGAKAAASYGLIANELITNALKYAFEGRDRGRIELSLSRAGDRIVFEVKDDGRGLPPGFDPAASSGFGMVLIRMLAEQLGGEYEFKGGSGLGFRLVATP
jgi:two-component sensor histidine kinase